MTSFLLFVISALLFLIAQQNWHHERTMAQLIAPRPRCSDIAPREEPFLLRRPPLRRPRFESYGVDVSFAPTIAVCGRLPSFTLRGWDAPLAPDRASW